jgi:hypothetical protein
LRDGGMFSSPLLWQIQYLVTTISKKNHKAHVAELNQVTALCALRVFARRLHEKRLMGTACCCSW